MFVSWSLQEHALNVIWRKRRPKRMKWLMVQPQLDFYPVSKRVTVEATSFHAAINQSGSLMKLQMAIMQEIFLENLALAGWLNLIFQSVTRHLLPPIFICFYLFSTSAVLLKFRTDKGRDPDPESCADDSQLLRQIRDDVLEAMGLSSDLLSDDFIR